MTPSSSTTTLTLPVAGMDCASCAGHVQSAVCKLDGVEHADVLVSAERAVVTFDPRRVTRDDIVRALGSAGYTVPATDTAGVPAAAHRDVGTILGWGVLGLVAVVVVLAALGERLGVLDGVLDRLPWWLPAGAIVLGGWPVLWGVIQAALQRRVTSHTLMTVGVLAAIAVGEWTTAALIVFFMRFADFLEDLTTARGRQALAQLTALRPETARVVRDGQELTVPVADVRPGDVVLVRPGERIPVDGAVIDGFAPVDQAPITGESLPVDKTVGDQVFAATIAQAGFLKVRAVGTADDTRFAHIVRLVEEAESQKAPIQRLADRFSAYYLPIVLTVALGTLLITGQVLNAVAVLVVACSCAIALATPVVVLASVGTAARRGVLIKGGLALEQLARVDTVVVDKTGTITYGTPAVTDIIALDGTEDAALLRFVATAEALSEHPLAQAIVGAARERGLRVGEPDTFTPVPGRGVVATIAGEPWAVGNRRLIAERGIVLPVNAEAGALQLEHAGRTAFFVARGAWIVGLIAVADTVRPEVRDALGELRRLGVRRVVMLTGDNACVARAVAGALDIEYRAELLPADKIAAVRALQAEGAMVMMVGDGVNDAPALTAANVGVAMGAAGSAVALEAADVALMRDDWRLVPEALAIGRRARRTIWQNLGFTALYNVVGLTLAATGVLPPVWAAAAQSLPDVAIMGNSARLLRNRTATTEPNAAAHPSTEMSMAARGERG